MTFKQRQLGLIPSPKDHRDFRLARIIPVKRTFPEQYTSHLIPEPYDQGDIGACVAFSLKAIKEMQEYKERQDFFRFSAAYIYGARDANDYKGEGMIPREALDILLHRGTCPEALFPGIYPFYVCNQKLTPAMHEKALPQRIQSYAAIHTIEEAKTALLELGPVAMGIQVYDSFFKGGHLPQPDTGREKLHGFHMVTLVGWQRDNRWLILNSWGKEWGDLKGFCTIPFNYPIIEMWSLTDLIAESQPQYEAFLIKRRSSPSYWTLRFGKFKSEDGVWNQVINPLTEDLNRLGKELKITRIRR